jgi:hypothetical protein
MWICLNDAFLSIVKKDCANDELLVRARRKGDIEKVFSGAVVTRYTKSDYLFRARVKVSAVSQVMINEATRINYANFKNSVKDKDLHDAYLKIWTAMAALQPTEPYTGKKRKVAKR